MKLFAAKSLEQTDPQHLVTALWVAQGLLNVLLSFIPPVNTTAALKMSATALCGIGISSIVTRLTRDMLDRPRPHVPLRAILLIVSSGTVLWFADSLFQSSTSPHPWSVSAFTLTRYNWVYFNLLFGLQTAVVALLISARRLAARDKQLIQAQLSALRLQLNPHFLFNTLNAISTLVSEGNAQDAGETLDRLADFLRVTLSDDLQALVTLSQELENTQAYLDIEAARFGDRLNIRYACAPEAAEVPVPSLILQPLVENAIKHAVAPSKNGATLSIDARVTDQNLVIVVQDETSLPRDTARKVGKGAGVGLRNVAARLEAHYGRIARLETQLLQQGFIATVWLPRTPVKA